MGDGELAESTMVVPDQSSEPRRTQFSIRTVLLAPLVLVVFVGLAAAVEDATDWGLFLLLGGDRFTGALNWLVGLDDPTGTVRRYVVFALFLLPEWTVLAVVTLVLGLRRSRFAHHSLAWLLALAFPVKDFIFDSWLTSSCDGSLPVSYNVQVVSALGAVIGIGAWYIGWRIRGRYYDLAVEHRPAGTSRSMQIVIWTLVLIASGYGWAALTRLK
ncbi:MAG: hypothetical protein GY835_23015 [bacterium]|nr:hypothetical protein [bacterium]